MSAQPLPSVSVALLAPGPCPQAAETLRVLRSRPLPRVAGVFGVGPAAAFESGLSVRPCAPSLASAKNTALAAAATDYVLLLAPGVVVAPCVVEDLASQMDQDPRLAATAVFPLTEGGAPLPIELRPPSLRRAALGTPPPRRPNPRLALWLPMDCALVRREAALEIGPWPLDGAFRFDDARWSLAARRRGWRLSLRVDLAAYLLSDRPPMDATRKRRLRWEAAHDLWLRDALGPARAGRLRLARRVRLALAAFALRLAARVLGSTRGPLAQRARLAAWSLEGLRQAAKAGC
ncbi:MAG TPA: hypothetical protein P5137_01165 [Candidatus Brocadiia bacterium]|nr:hypothetical protein [Candidatus Brocadiia bacterium]